MEGACVEKSIPQLRRVLPLDKLSKPTQEIEWAYNTDYSYRVFYKLHY